MKFTKGHNLSTGRQKGSSPNGNRTGSSPNGIRTLLLINCYSGIRQTESQVPDPQSGSYTKLSDVVER